MIDYKDLFKSLEKAVDDYTSEAFDGYEKEDVEGLLTDRLQKGKERLEEALETIRALCEPVEPPGDTISYIKYFCGKETDNEDTAKNKEQNRIALYTNTAALIRAYANIANEMEETGYSPKEIEEIKDEVKYFENVRTEIKLASGDYIDLKAYEPAMRHLIDSYISAEESKKISAFDDLTLVQLLVERGVGAIDTLPDSLKGNKEAVAETIENNLRKVIIEESPTNPRYYEKMSVLLAEIIKERKKEAKNYEAYLKRIVELSKQVQNPSSSTTYPTSINSSAKRALYDNLDQNEELASKIDYEIYHTKKDDWRGHKIKEKEVRYAIGKYIKDEKELDRIFEIVKNQKEY